MLIVQAILDQSDDFLSDTRIGQCLQHVCLKEASAFQQRPGRDYRFHTSRRNSKSSSLVPLIPIIAGLVFGHGPKLIITLDSPLPPTLNISTPCFDETPGALLGIWYNIGDYSTNIIQMILTFNRPCDEESYH